MKKKNHHRGAKTSTVKTEEKDTVVSATQFNCQVTCGESKNATELITYQQKMSKRKWNLKTVDLADYSLIKT